MNSSTRILKFDNDSDDEDSDNFEEIFYSASSYDRSSINSIPWAEDAIKQNLEEWERIERIFYDEESIQSIKNDKELYREILELKKSFPHLRINGKKIMSPNTESKYEGEVSDAGSLKFSYSDTELLTSDDEDITLASRNECIENKTKQNDMHSSRQPNNLIIRQENALPYNLESNLRISSVPVSKLIRVSNRQYSKSITEKQRMKQNNLPHIVPINSANFSNRQLNLTKPITSASFIRMPPIFSVIHHNHPTILNNSEQTTKVYISAQKYAPRRQNSTIILPSIDNNEKNKDYVRGTNRSISAVAGFNFNSPFRRSLEKYFE